MHNKYKILSIAIFLVIILNNCAYAGNFFYPLKTPKTGSQPIYFRGNSIGDVSRDYHVGWDLTIGDEDIWVYSIADGEVVSVSITGENIQSMNQIKNYDKLYHNGSGITIVIKHTLKDSLSLKEVNFCKTAGGIDYKTPSNLLEFTLGKTIYSKYSHMAPGTILVKTGDKVKGGMPIGAMGDSGNSTEPHLHFSISNKAQGPVKTTKESILFAADGHQPEAIPTRRFESNFEQYNCIASYDVSCNYKDPTVAVSPNYVYQYEYEDIKQAECVDTRERIKEILNLHDVNAKVMANYGNKKTSGMVPLGLKATINSYSKNFDIETSPNQLLKSANGVPTTAGYVPLKIGNYSYSYVGGLIVKDGTAGDKSISGQKTDYGKLDSAEFQNLIDRLSKEASVISAIALFASIVGLGIGFILKRNDAKERTVLASSIITICIAILIITTVNVLLNFASSFIG